jgi:hypothetical protein
LLAVVVVDQVVIVLAQVLAVLVGCVQLLQQLAAVVH